MGTKKKALIITDGSRTVRLIALAVKETLADYRVKILPAKRFAANDLFPMDIFFIGCKKPKPKTFAYLSQMLAHVNLASKKCGIFGPNEKTIKYLKLILTDSEADYGEPLINEEEDPKASVKKWLGKLIK